jgi:hypothetical protein
MSVSSTSQQGGVTAQSIGSVTQNVLPPIVRGPQLKKFQDAFTAGARVLRALKEDISDQKIDELCSATENWAGVTYSWTQKDIGDFAAERFAFRNGEAGIWPLSGEHKPGYIERRSNCIQGLSDSLETGRAADAEGAS